MFIGEQYLGNAFGYWELDRDEQIQIRAYHMFKIGAKFGAFSQMAVAPASYMDFQRLHFFKNGKDIEAVREQKSSSRAPIVKIHGKAADESTVKKATLYAEAAGKAHARRSLREDADNDTASFWELYQK